MDTQILQDEEEIKMRLKEQGHRAEFIDTILEMFRLGYIIVTYDGTYVYITLSEKGEKVVHGKGLNTQTQ